MQEIKDDLKAIRTDVNSIKTDIAKNTLSLEHHMARTEASEARITFLERACISLLFVAVIGGIIKLLTG